MQYGDAYTPIYLLGYMMWFCLLETQQKCFLLYRSLEEHNVPQQSDQNRRLSLRSMRGSKTPSFNSSRRNSLLKYRKSYGELIRAQSVPEGNDQPIKSMSDNGIVLKDRETPQLFFRQDSFRPRDSIARRASDIRRTLEEASSFMEDVEGMRNDANC
eukprot:8859393-Ditylum_brightwellii.AAC.1